MDWGQLKKKPTQRTRCHIWQFSLFLAGDIGQSHYKVKINDDLIKIDKNWANKINYQEDCLKNGFTFSNPHVKLLLKGILCLEIVFKDVIISKIFKLVFSSLIDLHIIYIFFYNTLNLLAHM